MGQSARDLNAGPDGQVTCVKPGGGGGGGEQHQAQAGGGLWRQSRGLLVREGNLPRGGREEAELSETKTQTQPVESVRLTVTSSRAMYLGT